MEKLETPFHTGNVALAFALNLAGVPFGQLPIFHFYDAGKLKELGYRGDIADAARAAWARREQGRIEYSFKQTPERSFIAEAFDDEKRKLKQAEDSPENTTPADLIAEIMRKFNDGIYSQGEAIARLSCVFSKARSLFLSAWRDIEPLVLIENEGEEEIIDQGENGRIVRKPGFKLVPLNPSDKFKERFGV